MTNTARSPPSLAGDLDFDSIRGIVRDRSRAHGLHAGAAVYPRVVDQAVPTARYITERYANNVVEADDGRLKARLRPMRGLTRFASARTISSGRAFVQNLRRGHYGSPLTNQSMIVSASPSANSHTTSDPYLGSHGDLAVA